MSTADQWAARVFEVAGDIDPGLVGKLARAELGLGVVVAIATRLAQAAELVLEGPGRGVEKSEAVAAVLRELNRRHGYRDKLRRRLPVYLRAFGLPVLERVLIDAVVAVLNTLGAWKITGPALEPRP